MAARIVIKCIKIKNKKYHIVEIFNRKMVERDTPNKQIHDAHLVDILVYHELKNVVQNLF
jgi:hypothetical protein